MPTRRGTGRSATTRPAGSVRRPAPDHAEAPAVTSAPPIAPPASALPKVVHPPGEYNGGRLDRSSRRQHDRREPASARKGPVAVAAFRLRPFHRLSVRVAAGFVAVTLLGIGLMGVLIYERQKQILQETLGTLLLSTARTGALKI